MTKVEEKLDTLIDEIRTLSGTIRGSGQLPWMTSKEAACYLRCSVTKLEDLTKAGMIPFRRLDSRSTRSPRLYHRIDLVKYLVAGRNHDTEPLSVSEKRRVKELT